MRTAEAEQMAAQLTAAFGPTIERQELTQLVCAALNGILSRPGPLPPAINEVVIGQAAVSYAIAARESLQRWRECQRVGK